MVVLSSVARKPQLRSLNVARVQGRVPRATKMSTSFAAKVQSTVTSKVPVAFVVKVIGPTLRKGRLPLPLATIVTTGGGGVGDGGGGLVGDEHPASASSASSRPP